MATSEFAKISRNRPDLQFERCADVRYYYRNTVPPLAYVRRGGSKRPGFIFCNDFMATMKSDKAARLEKYIVERDHSYLRFDYTDHGDSYFKKKTANEPIDEKNVLSPFPGPKPLKHNEKLLNFSMWKQDIVQLMAEFTDGPQILLGDGFGAWMALLVAIERPEKVKGVVALSSAVDMMARYMNARFGPDEKERMQAGETIWLHDHPDGPFVGSKRLVDDSKPFELLSRKGPLPVRCPIRFVHSMSDEFIPHGWMMRVVEKVQSQDVEVYLKKEGDHKFSTEQDYDVIYKAIDSMLALF